MHTISELDSTSLLLQDLQTPSHLSQLGHNAGHWAGYTLGKPMGRSMPEANADMIVEQIIENSLEQIGPDDIGENERQMAEILSEGYLTDYTPGNEFNSFVYILSEDWLDPSLWNVYFHAFSLGLIDGVRQAQSELKSEQAPNVVSLFGKR